MNFLLRATVSNLRLSTAAICLVTASLTTAFGTAYADQTEPQTSIESLPDVMVSATRSTSLPGSIATSKILIDREQIELSGASTVAEVLSSIAGVQLRDLYGDGTSVTISMRGFGGNAAMNTLIMVDGRRLNNFLDIGSARLSGISVSQIEAIEIISGSAGVLFGEGAVGGVVNIITRKPANRINLEASLGNYENRHYRFSAATQTGAWDYSIAAGQRKADNYRDYNASDVSTVDLELGHTLKDGRLWIEFNGSDEFQELAGALLSAQYAANRKASLNTTDFYDSRYRSYRAGANLSINENWHFEVDFTKRFDDINGSLESFGSSVVTKQERNQSSFNPRFIGRFGQAHGDLVITAGLDYDDANYFFGTFMGVQLSKQKTSNFFAQVLAPIASDLQLQAGIRSTKFDTDITDTFSYPNGVRDDDSFHLFSVGLDWVLSENVSLFVRRAENARTAKIDEHTNSYAPGFVPVLLKHQYGVSLETGVNVQLDLTTLKFSYYEIKLNDEIVYDGVVANSNINLDTTKRVGADFSVLSYLSPAVSFRFQLSLVDATFDSGPYSNKEIPFVARQNISAGLNYRLAEAGSLHFEWLETGKRFAASDFDNLQDKLKSQNQLNVAWRQKIQHFIVEARVNNVMDRENVAFATETYGGGDVGFYAAPTRNFLVTVSYQPE